MSSCLADRRIMLLMPATSYRATDFLTAARRLNAEVIVASDHTTVLAEFTGDRCLRVGLTPSDENVARIVEHARRTHVNAARGAARPSQLRHMPPAPVATARARTAFRPARARAGRPGPGLGVWEAREDLPAAAAGRPGPGARRPPTTQNPGPGRPAVAS